METNRECVCCKEIPKILEKMSKLEVPVNCITEHPGFDGVCLNVWVLQTAYYQYRQHYDTTASSTALHEYVKLVYVSVYCLLSNFFLLFISTLLQEIQIYSIQTVDKVVLGLARKRYSSHFAFMCCEQNSRNFPFRNLYWV